MQWKYKGHCPTEYKEKYFTIQEIRDFLDTPCYEPKRLKEFILDPAVTELNKSGIFKNLELVVHKAKKRGSPVVGYSFNFEAFTKLTQEQKKAIEHKEAGDYKPTEELKKEATKKKKSNRFNDFPQREYSKEEINALEQRFLQRK